MGHQILSLLWPIYVYCVPANTIMYRKYFPNTAHHHLDQSNAKVGATPVTAIYFQYLTHHHLDQGNTKVGVTAIYVHKNTCKHSTTYLHTSIKKRFRNPILPAPPKWDSKVLFQLFLNSRRRFFSSSSVR